MNVVSFETAKRLKDAGFPQPEFTEGQVWFNAKNQHFSILLKCGATDPLNGLQGNLVYSELSNWSFVATSNKPEEAVFAPTETDILKELGEEWTLSFILSQTAGWDVFMCKNLVTKVNFQHNNPAEACAAAYLSIHEKTTKQ